MYIVRDIFYLKFGHFRDVKALFDEANTKKMFPENPHARILSDFTGRSYRFIFENGYNTLADLEKAMSDGTNEKEWREWYMKFMPHIETSEREILKLHS